MYIDPKTRETFSHAYSLSCFSNLQNVLALKLNSKQRYALTREPVLREKSTLFEPKQIQSAINTNDCTGRCSLLQR